MTIRSGALQLFRVWTFLIIYSKYCIIHGPHYQYFVLFRASSTVQASNVVFNIWQYHIFFLFSGPCFRQNFKILPFMEVTIMVGQKISVNENWKSYLQDIAKNFLQTNLTSFMVFITLIFEKKHERFVLATFQCVLDNATRLLHLFRIHVFVWQSTIWQYIYIYNQVNCTMLSREKLLENSD